MAPRTGVPNVPVCKPGEPTTEKCCVHGEQKPDIKSLSGPFVLGQSGYDWQITWKLPAKTCNGGFVIQEIAKLVVYDLDGGGTDGHTKHFWEAWPIPKGDTVSHWSIDDTYHLPPQQPPYSAGKVTITGFAKFYEIEKLPPAFYEPQTTPETRTEAGFTYSTTKRPPFWDRAGATEHNLTFEWNCRVEPATTFLVGECNGRQYSGTPQP